MTYKLDLDMVKMNHDAKYLGRRSFQASTQTHTHTHTHTHAQTADRLQYVDYKVVGGKVHHGGPMCAMYGRTCMYT